MRLILMIIIIIVIIVLGTIWYVVQNFLLYLLFTQSFSRALLITADYLTILHFKI